MSYSTIVLLVIALAVLGVGYWWKRDHWNGGRWDNTTTPNSPCRLLPPKMLCEKHVGLESSNPLRNGDCSYFFKLNKHMTFYGWRESISDCGKPSDRTSGLMDPLSLTPCILQYEFYNRFYRQWDADSSTV